MFVCGPGNIDSVASDLLIFFFVGHFVFFFIMNDDLKTAIIKL